MVESVRKRHIKSRPRRKRVFYRDVIVNRRPSVAEYEVNITVSSVDEGVDLGGLANASVEKMGKLISLETDERYVGGGVSKIDLKLGD